MTKIELKYSEENGYYVLMYRDDKLVKRASNSDFTYNMEKLSSYDKVMKNGVIKNDTFIAELYDGIIEFHNLEKYDELLTKYFPKSYTDAKTKLLAKQKRAEIEKRKAEEKAAKALLQSQKEEAKKEEAEIIAKEKARANLIKDYEKAESKKVLEAKKREEETLKKEKRQENLRLREEERQKTALEDATKKEEEERKAKLKRYNREKKAELRHRKIDKVNRIATVAGTVVVCVSLAASLYFLGYKEVISKINHAAESNRPRTEIAMVNDQNYSSSVDDIVIHNINIPITSTEEKANAYLIAEEKYKDIIPELAETYGVDQSLLTAICASNLENKDGIANSSGKIGPMNISYYNLEGRSFRVYNYKQKTWDTIVVNQEKLKDNYQNIKIGCALIQMAYRDNSHNLVIALESSELGKYTPTKLQEKIMAYAKNTVLSYADIISNKDNYEWYSVAFQNDDSYFGKIASYLPAKQILSMRSINYLGSSSTDFYTVTKPLEKELESTY